MNVWIDTNVRADHGPRPMRLLGRCARALSSVHNRPRLPMAQSPPIKQAVAVGSTDSPLRSEGSGPATLLPVFEDVAEDHSSIDSWADPVSIVPLEHPEVLVAKLISNLLDGHPCVGHERRS